jgi:hypothetical protein
MLEHVYWIVVVTFSAGLMRGFAGFGSGMLMAPFFVSFFGPVHMIILIAVLELVVTMQLMPSVYRLIDRPLMLPMGIVAALSMPIGIWLLLMLDPRAVSVCVGVVILGFSLSLMLGWQYTGPRPKFLSWFIGGCSGVLLAFTSLGNPPVILYLMSSNASAATIRANFTGYFGLTLVALILWMSACGLFTLDAGAYLLWLVPVFVSGAWLGSRFFRRANDQLYRRIALAVLCMAGLYSLVGS